MQRRHRSYPSHPDHAAAIQPLADDIVLVAIILGRAGHAIGRLQAVLLPDAMAVERPVQNARKLVEQIVANIRVLLLWRDRDREVYDSQPAPNGVIPAASL